MNQKIKPLAEGAIMIALATILSFIKIFQLPYGGSITLFSMLPICIIAYKYGWKRGVLCGFVYGCVQSLFDTIGGAAVGMSLGNVLLMLFLDYFLAFAVLGFAGVFRGKFKSDTVSFILGILFAILLRLLCHALSGYILFSSYAEWFFSQEGFTFGEMVLTKMQGQVLYIFYAFFYNMTYLVPEAILSVIGGSVLLRVLKKNILQ